MSRPPFWRIPRNARQEPEDDPVVAGSSSDGQLQRGDVIKKINGKSTSLMTHQKACDTIKNAGSAISLQIKRETPQENVAAVGSNSADSGQVPTTPRFENIMASPVANLPVTSFAGSQLSRQQELFAGSCAGDRERIVVTNQPYRTTPLVLPGAKVARDTATTQTTSYLALQTNPLLWSSTPGAPSYVNPQQAASDALLRQKLEAASAVVQRNLAISAAAEQAQAQAAHEPPPKQEVVHKQFNSPLGLYSKENVEEVMALQSGLIPPNPKAQPALDLKNSETLKALLEDDVSDARGMKEYRPTPVKVLPVNPPFKVNTLGKAHETIQQSYSFKRLMADVLGETEF